MKLTPHQKIVVSMINESANKEITKKQVCERIRFYHNTEHHVGEILSRMVKMAYIRRIKNGVFGVGSGMIAVEEIKNQTNLF